MKINQVEALSGIPKKNIRFYEEQGLLSPPRNAENGYREYGDEEVRILGRIKFLRKLGVPIEEIRQLFSGKHTVADIMRRHLITLEREKRNLEQSVILCQELQKLDIPAEQLDAGELLARMETMERGGTTFQNSQTQDIHRRYIAPVAVTLVMVTLMTGLIGLILWAYFKSRADAPPLWFLMLIIAMLGAVGFGVVLALLQRIREIEKGEIDDARHY